MKRWVLFSIWLYVQAQQVTLTPNTQIRVTQSASWSYFALSSDLVSQYWVLSLSIVNTYTIALMVRSGALPDIDGGTFTADYLDVSSWQYNLTSHLLFFQPQDLGNSTSYAGVYLFNSGFNSSTTYLIKVSSQRASFCPNDCSGKGACSGAKCTCEAGFLGIDCRIPASALSSESVVTPVLSGKWKVAALPVHSGCNPHTARVTVTTQASSNALDLRLYMSSAKPG